MRAPASLWLQLLLLPPALAAAAAAKKAAAAPAIQRTCDSLTKDDLTLVIKTRKDLEALREVVGLQCDRVVTVNATAAWSGELQIVQTIVVAAGISLTITSTQWSPGMSQSGSGSSSSYSSDLPLLDGNWKRVFLVGPTHSTQLGGASMLAPALGAALTLKGLRLSSAYFDTGGGSASTVDVRAGQLAVHDCEFTESVVSTEGVVGYMTGGCKALEGRSGTRHWFCGYVVGSVVGESDLEADVRDSEPVCQTVS
ncbi:hypothetical protein JKP88DRAFT_253974 [Tribonema minus]|uniref:Uncharacterized protein n=1 Tax=Tribonema minus TaxID=303371 RepID=A0A835Z6Z7_9STRA|nr:hypothetical protein JKP88DRAFT_253974 [Tribonema minus]